MVGGRLGFWLVIVSGRRLLVVVGSDRGYQGGARMEGGWM